MARIAVDAGVVIGHLDARDIHHDAATRALDRHAGDDLRMPASAYAEVLARPARQGRMADAKRRFWALGIAVDPVDARMAERAAMLRGASKSLLLADAVVLAYAEDIEADRVLTTDRRLARLSPVADVVA